MASKIKQKLAKNFYDVLRSSYIIDEYHHFLEQFSLNRSDNNDIYWSLSLRTTEQVDSNILNNSQKELFENNSISKITCRPPNIVDVKLDQKSFVKDVLDSDPISLNFLPIKKKVIVEFSSPNIAKPFHVGHLRSTMIGNFLANVKTKLGNDVVRLNYLGDWGTQFGMIQIGVEYNKYSLEDLKKDPISLLYKAYVAGNTLAQRDDKSYEKVKKIFESLEKGDEEVTNSWAMYRKWTIDELSKTYSRLGVTFDEYSWESDYKRTQADEILKKLHSKGILTTDEKGRKVAKVGDRVMPLIKSDDTSLYLIRDLLAVIDRKSKHNFDELYYVVENGQSDHFISLLTLCKELNISDGVTLKHVKFGRMHGMSTRRGKVVFLKDILDEARERAMKLQMESKTTKVPLNENELADILGVTAVVVNDLKHKRKSDYAVSWEEMLKFSGNTGNYLQYCNCRLSNLKLNCGHLPASDCDPDALKEPEVINLIFEIARYESALLRANAEFEPSVFLRYMFDLVHAINVAMKTINVKKSDSHVGSQRLMLFNKSQQVLEDGLRLLGLKPLQKM